MKFFYTSIFCILIYPNIQAQNKELDSVVIIGTSKVNKGSFNGSKIGKERIAQMPFETLNEALTQETNVNVQSRGFLSTQSDISIRGGSYEQVGILFNGIRINDPQTGHNTMTVPFLLQDIEKIEVVKTSSSKYFGQNAYSGAILFSSLVPVKNSVRGMVSIGSYQTFNSNLSGDWVGKRHWHRLSLGFLNSNGYRTNTDAETMQLFNENHFFLGKSKTVDCYATMGINSKKFGANGFYSLRFPNQYEELQSYFYNVGIKANDLKVDLYWKQNNDYYVLKRENPAFYKNVHHTDVRGAQVTYSRLLVNGLRLNTTAEYRNEAIKSTNLGDRTRSVFNFNANMDIHLTKNLETNIGGNINYTNGFDPFVTGGFNMVYRIAPSHSVYGSFNSAFRLPTFTELYYTSPTDSGNSNLLAEHARTFDLGYKYNNKFLTFALNGFLRWTDNQIDWVKKNDNATYYVSKNYSSLVARG
ncbi:MAG: TonB-dependent receptor plug domain-containing protein, partial [Thermoflexibacteraceae bacterium]